MKVAVPASANTASAGTASATAFAGGQSLSCRWTPQTLAARLATLRDQGAPALDALSTAQLLEAWEEALTQLRDPESPQQRSLAPHWAATSGLSSEGLNAAVDVLLAGWMGAPSQRLAAVAEERLRHRRSSATGGPTAGPAVVLLAGNLPALAAQPLLPALLARRPTLLKSPSANPWFAPVLAASLARICPPLADAVAAVTWSGGDEALEAPMLTAADPLVVYGDEATLRSLEARRREVGAGPITGFGPGWSLAAIDGQDDNLFGSRGKAPEALAEGLARDIALFDQRGCLSLRELWIQATEERTHRFAAALAAALRREARRLPPGPAPTALLGALRLRRDAAELRGDACFAANPEHLEAGTVIVTNGLLGDEPPRPLPVSSLPSLPPLRAVRLQRVAALRELPAYLSTQRGQLQGAVLAGDGALALASELRALGVHHTAEPGRLQYANALWANGGHDPLAIYGLPNADQESTP